MQRTREQDNRKGGFALIVVLFSLLVITALFATVQKRALGQLYDVAAEELLIVNGQTGRDLLELAITVRAKARSLSATNFTASLNGRVYEVKLQDVSGLIDLNAASPDLLQRLANRLRLVPGAITTYLQWRRTPRRLLRVEDFARITGAGPAAFDELRSVATVHSGSQGLAPGATPTEVLNLVGVETSDDIPETLRSTQSATNYRVSLRRPGTAAEIALGIIHVAPSIGQSRVLQIF
jgi:hypothetical protein